MGLRSKNSTVRFWKSPKFYLHDAHDSHDIITFLCETNKIVGMNKRNSTQTGDNLHDLMEAYGVEITAARLKSPMWWYQTTVQKEKSWVRKVAVLYRQATHFV